MSGYQAGEHSNRERTAAEPEREDAITFPIVAADEPVQIQHIAFQPPAEGTPQECKHWKRSRTYPIIVKRKLIRAIEIERFIDAPDICLEYLGRTVSRAVGKHDEIASAHLAFLELRRRFTERVAPETPAVPGEAAVVVPVIASTIDSTGSCLTAGLPFRDALGTT